MDGPPADVLEQGTEPTAGDGMRRRTWRLRGVPAALPAIVLALAVVAGGAWYAGRPALPTARPAAVDGGARGHASRATTELRHAPDPPTTPFGVRTVEGLALAHELTLPAAPAEDTFIASSGHVLLFLQVHNGGARPVRVVDGLVPQDGIEPDQAAGGLSAGTSSGGSLAPGSTAEVFVRLRVECGTALGGAPTDRLLLVSQVDGRRPLMQVLPLARTAALWDEARHAACAPAPAATAVTARLVPGSLRAVRGAAGQLVVRGSVRVHDSAGFQAQLLWGSGESTYVGGGSTVAASVGWEAGTCRRPAPTPAAPSYRVRLPDGTAVTTADVGERFSDEWAAALAAACQ